MGQWGKEKTILGERFIPYIITVEKSGFNQITDIAALDPHDKDLSRFLFLRLRDRFEARPYQDWLDWDMSDNLQRRPEKKVDPASGNWGDSKFLFDTKFMPHISDVTHKIDDIVLRSKAGTEFADNLLKVVKSLFIGLAYPVWKDYKHWDKEEPAATLSCEFPELKPEDIAGFHGRDYPSGDFKTFGREKHYVGIFNTITGKYRPFPDEPGMAVFLEKGEELVERKPLMKKPPIGLMPRKLHLEQRLSDLCAAISRYFSSGKKIPVEWLNELNDIIDEVQDA